MKKFITLAAALALILTALTACDKTPEQTLPESTGETSTSTSESVPVVPESTSESKPESAPQSSSESESSDVSEEQPPEIPKDFKLSDYITDFEDVELIGFSYVSELSFPQADEAAVAKAVEAYRSSEMYAEVKAELEEMYHYENGELIRGEEYIHHYRAEDLVYYIDKSAAPEIALKTDTLKSYRARLNGENEESLILLRAALPLSYQDWSGSVKCHIPVYVNADGEAHILYDACSQDYGEFRLLSCTDGTFHALFGFGHNQHGQDGAVYSFKDGKPRLELSGCPISLYNYMLMGGYGWDCFEPFMFDKENGEFCAIAAVSPSEELAKIICSDKIITAYVPDAWEYYQKDRLQIIGGKYVTFATGIPWNDDTFVYNSDKKRFERVEPVTVTGNALPEQVTKTRNVKLE